MGLGLGLFIFTVTDDLTTIGPFESLKDIKR